MLDNKLKYIIQIDGLRCFAVLGVLISHYIISNLNQSILNKIPFGTGVNLFFVISGYLISFILFNKKVEIENKTTSFNNEIKNFFIKRILRIFPLYYLVIGFLVIFNYEEVKDYLIYLITYSTNIYMTFHNTYLGSRTHLWSLSVEEQFYLIWPFILFFVSRKYILKIIFLFVLLSLICKFYFLNYTQYQIGSNAFLICCFDSLSLGALLAYLQIFNFNIFEKLLNKKVLFILISFYVFLFIYPDLLPNQAKNLLNNFFTSVIYFFIVGIATQNKFTGITKFFLENKVSTFIGKISYGIYIIHNFMPDMFYNFFAKRLPPTDHHSIRVLYWISLTILCATISWFLIEKPFLSLKKKFN